ncbi:energy-coupling factor transporter transmembrane component T [Aeromonas hydrophila]|uniref:energy-coupling factor transporter transmembrane component T n=1 Tax=Aeromonas hydrophila TaxID=644 RepID=UPI002361DE2C|nr:energy-coupling factor transporter transmembrane component T [Aeromonas hydrophila]WDA23110.1 energy-coupling factor transporter transmembrane component T [Aeromonas hydrophila]WES93173.1 energy-coupling factor transporter transmembrane component T [Aeromonas hydrophila]
MLLNNHSLQRRFSLDPRTKILLLLSISVFVVSGVAGNDAWIRSSTYLLAVIPLLLLGLEGRFYLAGCYGAVYSACLYVAYVLVPITEGLTNSMLLVLVGVFTRILPAIFSGIYLVSTTTVSEFLAACRKLGMPQQITIPLAVVFRFFPTFISEAIAIEKSLAMRGLRFKHIIRLRLLPLLINTTRISEELSAAALSRGLSASVKRSERQLLTFSWHDYLVLAIIALPLCFLFISLLFR